MFVVLLMMLHPTQELEPPANPARFNPVYQDDEKWYELVLQAERARRGGGSGADDFAGGLPMGGDDAGTSGSGAATTESTSGAEVGDEEKTPDITLAEPDLTLSRTYEVPELPGDIVIKVEAFRHKEDIGGHPYRIIPKGFGLQFDYNSRSPFFEDNVLQPSDYLIIDIAQQATAVSSQTIRDYPVSYIGRLLRDKYFPSDSGDVSQAARAAGALLGELRRHFDETLVEVAPINLDEISSRELENIRRIAFRSESMNNAQADECIAKGEFARFVSEEYLKDIVERWPATVMDGTFFERPYAQLSTDQRTETVTQLAECLKDVIWLVEDGASALNKDRDWRLRLTRALASLRLLESWAQ